MGVEKLRSTWAMMHTTSQFGGFESALQSLARNPLGRFSTPTSHQGKGEHSQCIMTRCVEKGDEHVPIYKQSCPDTFFV